MVKRMASVLVCVGMSLAAAGCNVDSGTAPQESDGSAVDGRRIVTTECISALQVAIIGTGGKGTLDANEHVADALHSRTHESGAVVDYRVYLKWNTTSHGYEWDDRKVGWSASFAQDLDSSSMEESITRVVNGISAGVVSCLVIVDSEATTYKIVYVDPNDPFGSTQRNFTLRIQSDPYPDPEQG